MTQPRTLKELADWPECTIGTRIAAPFLGVDQWTVTLLARQNQLPCKFFFSGNRLKISKQSLLEFLGYTEALQ